MELLNAYYNGPCMRESMGFAKRLVPNNGSSGYNAGPANFNDANKVPFLRLDSIGESTSDEEITAGNLQDLPILKSTTAGHSQFPEASMVSHPLCQWSSGESVSLCTTAHKMYSRLPNHAMDSSHNYSYVFPAQGSRYLYSDRSMPQPDMQKIAAKSTLNPNAPAWFPTKRNQSNITSNVETTKSEPGKSRNLTPPNGASLEIPGIELSLNGLLPTTDLVDTARIKPDSLVPVQENEPKLSPTDSHKKSHCTREDSPEEPGCAATKSADLTETPTKEVKISLESAKKLVDLPEMSAKMECVKAPLKKSESIPVPSCIQSLCTSSPSTSYDLSLVQSPPSNFALNFFLLPQQDDISDCDSGWDDEDDSHLADCYSPPLSGLQDPVVKSTGQDIKCHVPLSLPTDIYEDFAPGDLSDFSGDLALEEVNSKWEDAYCDIQPTSKATKVSFPEDCILQVYPVDPRPEMEHAYAECRKGPWEEYARDHQRFQNRIKNLEDTISPCLDPEHRRKILEKLKLDE